jgi:ribonuclease P protein component
VFSSKHRSSDKSFLFLTQKNGINLARLGLAVPKKHIHRSVDRNRLKRIIRESFRLRQKQLEGKDVVVVVKNHLNVNRDNVDSILAEHWDKIIK